MAAGKAVTVYCASSVGNHPVYVRAAQCRCYVIHRSILSHPRNC